jgi:hypothetical protein
MRISANYVYALICTSWLLAIGYCLAVGNWSAVAICSLGLLASLLIISALKSRGQRYAYPAHRYPN